MKTFLVVYWLVIATILSGWIGLGGMIYAANQSGTSADEAWALVVFLTIIRPTISFFRPGEKKLAEIREKVERKAAVTAEAAALAEKTKREMRARSYGLGKSSA